MGIAIHLCVWIMPAESVAGISLVYFKASLLVMFPAWAFIKNRSQAWMQLRCCPKWFWLPAFILWGYGIACVAFSCIFSSSIGDPLAETGISIGFNALSLCLLLSVWKGNGWSLADLRTRTVISWAIIGTEIAWMGKSFLLH
jgi:hypothetical protein